MSKKRNSKLKNTLFSVFSLILGLIIGLVGELYLAFPDSYMIPQTVQGTVVNSSKVTEGAIDSDVIQSNDISFHFLELGNKYTGDCIYIKCGDTDILVDGGSRTTSVPFIYNYIDSYMEDDCLDYIIVTHAHQDHYAGFATGKNTKGIFDLYEVGTIIDFGKATSNSDAAMFNRYITKRDAEI